MSRRTHDTLVYLLYGHGSHYDEAVYSILSALHHARRDGHGYRIAVYTDEPDALGDLPVETEMLSDAVLAEWSGPLAFNHRRKILAIKHALKRFGGRVLLCDSDTWFIRHPVRAFNRIRPGQTVLHVAEFRLSDRCARPLAEALAGHTFRKLRGDHWGIDESTCMFNSGLIGLHESDMDLLDEVVYLTDQIYEYAPLPTIEQFAFSVCFQKITRIRQSYDVVCHYWPPPSRALFHEHLRGALHESPALSHQERFLRLMPRSPKIAVHPFHLGRPHMARRVAGQARNFLSRAVSKGGVKGHVRRIMTLMHHITATRS